MTVSLTVALVVALLAIGVGLGASGYGGFLVPPLLVWLADLPDPRTAVAYALSAAVVPTLIGALLYRRTHRTPWLVVATLCVGTVPGIALGRWLAASASDSMLRLLIGLSVVVAGLAVLRRRSAPPPAPLDSGDLGGRRRRLVPVGLGAGVLSGVAGVVVGVGGPLVTTPILLSSGMSLTGAIGAGMANAVLVNVVGSVSLLQGVTLDPALLLLVAGPQLVGVVVGVRLHHRVSTAVLSRVIAAVAVTVGIVFVVQAARS